MLTNFKELIDAKGASLCDPIGFGKNKGKHLWQVPETYWQSLCTKNGIQYYVILDKIKEAKYHKQLLDSKAPRRGIVPEKITEFLYPHQKEFILKLGDIPHSNLWAAIGTGKTYAYLELVKSKIRAGEKVLILCPKTVFSSWNNAIKSYLGDKATFVNVKGMYQEKLQKLNYEKYFYITNYESLLNKNILEALKQKGFSFIVADEAHKYFSNTSTRTYKAAMDLSANIEIKHVLTGTPRRSKDENLYGLITFLDRGERFGASFYAFRKKYFVADYMGFSYDFNENLRKEFWDKIKSISYIVTKDVLNLPERTEQIIEIELTEEAAKHYADMHKDAMIEVDKYKNMQYSKVIAPIAIAKITKLRQLCSGFVRDTEKNETIVFNQDKLIELDNILNDISEPVIITCCYTQEIEQISKLLKDKNLSFGVISGKIKDTERNIYIDKISKKELDTLIIQEDSGGVGIDGLQNHCSLMIRYSYGYSFDTDEQIIGRIERSGQKKSMRVIRLKATINGKETIENAIIGTIKNKCEGFENLVKNIKENI